MWEVVLNKLTFNRTREMCCSAVVLLVTKAGAVGDVPFLAFFEVPEACIDNGSGCTVPPS
jgi:hypothetical protein